MGGSEEDLVGVEDAWFAIVTAEVSDVARLEVIATTMLALALDQGIITFAVTPVGVTAVVGAAGREEAERLGARLVWVARKVGAARAIGRLTSEIEEAIPAARKEGVGG